MTTEKPGLHPETLVAQGLGHVAQPFGDIVAPIHVATTYERGADGAYPGGRVYSRADNPTYDQVEALIASLEGAAGAMVFASGQAASGAVFLSLLPGEGVLAPRNMYWALRKWLTGFLAPRGHPVAFYDNAVPDDLARQARAVRPRLIWVETPANPTWDITDIAAASAIAREVRATLAVDSTVATPLLTRPIALGADIVMHSATKYLNGHADVIAGALATARDDERWQALRYVRGGGGAILGPFESWLLLRGMRTLHLRVAAACANAQAIALRFHGHARLSVALLTSTAANDAAAYSMTTKAKIFLNMNKLLRCKKGKTQHPVGRLRGQSHNDTGVLPVDRICNKDGLGAEVFCPGPAFQAWSVSHCMYLPTPEATSEKA